MQGWRREKHILHVGTARTNHGNRSACASVLMAHSRARTPHFVLSLSLFSLFSALSLKFYIYKLFKMLPVRARLARARTAPGTCARRRREMKPLNRYKWPGYLLRSLDPAACVRIVGLLGEILSKSNRDSKPGALGKNKYRAPALRPFAETMANAGRCMGGGPTPPSKL